MQTKIINYTDRILFRECSYCHRIEPLKEDPEDMSKWLDFGFRNAEESASFVSHVFGTEYLISHGICPDCDNKGIPLKEIVTFSDFSPYRRFCYWQNEITAEWEMFVLTKYGLYWKRWNLDESIKFIRFYSDDNYFYKDESDNGIVENFDVYLGKFKLEPER